MGVGHSRVGLVCALALLAAVLPARPVSAAVEGYVDVAFGAGGVVATTIGSGGEANAVVVQSDGKIIAAGLASAGGSEHFALARYTKAGVLDSTFDKDGVTLTNVIPNGDANAVAIQPDGKIVAAGSTSTGSVTKLAVARYTPTGALDPSFGSGGKITLLVGPRSAEATGVAIQPDGKIVVGGDYFDGTTSRFVVVRYTATGALDPSFNHNGIQKSTAIGDDAASAGVALLPDGEIAVGGFTQVGAGDLDFAVALYRPDGSLDTHFGGTGTVVTDVGNGHFDNFANSITAEPDGKLVVSGWGTGTGLNATAAVVRYTANGTLDPTFGSEGVALIADTGVRSNNAARSVAIQHDGRIVVAGNEGESIVVHRLSANGHLEPAFAVDGFVVAPIPAGANGVAIAPDGTIIAAGQTPAAQGPEKLVLAAFVGDRTAPWGARVLGLPTVSLGGRTISWMASDTGTGVRTFDVRRRFEAASAPSFGAWTGLRTNTTDVFGALPFGPAGTTECVEARGRDFAGNIGAFGAPACTTFPIDDRGLTAHGAWTRTANAADYRGTAMTATSSTATLTTNSYFRHLAVVVTLCPTCGVLSIGIGNFVLSIDTKGATTHRQIFDFGSSVTLQHATITLKPALNNGRVIVDGLAVGP